MANNTAGITPLVSIGRRCVVVLGILIVAGRGGSGADEPPTRPRVAIAWFDPKGLPDSVNPKTLTDLLLDFGKGGLRHEAVLPTEYLDKVIDRIRKEGIVDGKLPKVDLGKAQAHFLLMPNASRFGDEWVMTAPLIDLKSGDFRVVKASRKGGDASQLKGLVEDFWRELDQPHLRLTLQVPGQSPIGRIEFSPDGKVVIASSHDASLVYDIATGRLLATIQHAKFHGRVLSADGKFLACAIDRTAHVWEVGIGKLLADLKHDVPVLDVAFSPDGKRILTKCSEVAHLWDTTTWQRRIMFTPGQGKRIRAVVFTSAGEPLATTATGEFVKVPNMVSPTVGKPIQIGFTQEFRENTIHIWDVSTNKERRTLTPGGYLGHGERFSPSGEFMISASSGGPISLWNVTNGQLQAPLAETNLQPGSIVFTPDGRVLALNLNNGNILVLDAAEKKRTVIKDPAVAPDSQVLSVALSTDGKLLAAQSRSGGEDVVRVWDLATGREQDRLKPGGRIHSLAFSPDRKCLFTTSEGKISVWGLAP